MIKSGLDFSAKTKLVLLIVGGGTSQEYWTLLNPTGQERSHCAEVLIFQSLIVLSWQVPVLCRQIHSILSNVYCRINGEFNAGGREFSKRKTHGARSTKEHLERLGSRKLQHTAPRTSVDLCQWLEVETKHVPVGFGKLLAHTDRCDLL